MDKKTLLIVDDFKVYRLELREKLLPYFDIDSCGSLAGALTFMQSKKYDAIITDDYIPEFGDVELKSPVKKDYRGIMVASAGKEADSYIIGITSDNKLMDKADVSIERTFQFSIIINLLKKQFDLK